VANTVTISVDADTKTAEKNVKGMGAKFSTAMKGVAVAAGGITLAAGAASKLGEEYQEATNTIAAGTGASGEQLKGLTESFKEVWGNVPQDAAAVSSAIADVNTEMGLEGEALEDVTTAFLDVSRAMGEEAGPMIKAVADSMIAFGVPASDTESVLDKLTAASQAAGVPITNLADTMVNFGPQLNELGLPMDDAIALIANMESSGINAAKMMPGLNTAIKKLADGGVTDITAGLQDAIKSIQNAESDSKGLAIAMDLFGAGAGLRFKDAIDKGAFSLDDMLAAMGDSEGKVEELGAVTLTTSDKFDIMKNKVKGALTPIGSFATALGPLVIMIPAMTTAIAAMGTTQIFTTAMTWAQSAAMTALNLAMGPIGLIILGIVAAIVAAIVIFKNWDKIVDTFKNTWDVVWGAVKSVFDTVMGLIESVFNSKFGWILPGGALVKAVFLLRDNWDTIWNTVKDVWATVSGAISDAFTSKWGWLLPGGALIKAIMAIKKNWDDIWAAIEILAIVAWEEISKAFTKWFGWALPGGAIHTALNEVKDLWDSVWSAVQSGFDTLASSIQKVWTDYFGWLRPGGAIDKALTEIKETWDSVWDGIKDTFGTIGAFIQSVWTDYFGWLRPGGAIDKALDAFQTKWESVWEAIKDFVKGPVNFIVDGINKLIDLFNALEIGWEAKKVRGVTVIPEFKFAPFNIPHITKMAQGGIVTKPTLAMIGEAGPEAVVPLGRGGGVGATTLTINILGPTYGFDDFEERVTEAIQDGVRRGGFSGILATA
jgi:TP901 family phage tail tape measure protein